MKYYREVVVLLVSMLFGFCVGSGHAQIFMADPPTPTAPEFQVEPIGVQHALEPSAPDIGTNIEGPNYDDNGTHTGRAFIPPDPIGAAGPGHLVCVVNVSIEWHTKQGVQQKSDSLKNFFTSLSPDTFTFDPKVIYDQYADRFVVVTLERTDTSKGDLADTSRILLAVSDDSDPNGTWYFHAIDSKTNISGKDHWADYPGFAVDEEAIYITNNMFTFIADGSSFGEVRLWIVDKSPFYSGGAASVSIYSPDVVLGDNDPASFTLQPAHIFGTAPVGTGTFMVMYSGLTGGGNEYLRIFRIDDPLGTPAFSMQYVFLGDLENPLPSLPDAPQMGTTTEIETNDRRALHAVWRDDALWTTMTIAPSTSADAGQATAHWVKVNTSNLSSLAVADQGSVGAEDVASGTHTFFPSVAVDRNGNMGIGFAASASTIFPGAYYTGRMASDAPGTVQSTGVLAAGQDYYIRIFPSQGGTRNRWGDYSGICLDPINEGTFWVFNEYALTRGSADDGEDGRWGTRWGSFLLDSSLPVTLTSFEGVSTEDGVQLSWRTVSEVNNLGWYVYRREASGSITEVGFVKGAQNSEEVHDYAFLDDDVTPGLTYTYHLEDTALSGEKRRSSIIKVVFEPKAQFAQKPFEYRLLPSYPNPFNPEVWIPYELASQATVHIRIYSVDGQLVRELDQGVQSPGSYVKQARAAYWDGRDSTGESVGSGVYFYQLVTERFSATRKLVVRK